MKIQDIQEKKFAWGGKSFAAPFTSKEVVSVVGSVGGGSRTVRSICGTFTKQGAEFAKIHAEMLLEGTRTKSKRDIQSILDELGASLSFSSSPERLLFAARVRKKYLPRLLALIAEILKEPAFKEEELKLLKKREEAALFLEAQDTHEQAGIGLTRLLYKGGHPNFSESTGESREVLKHITAKSLADYHAQSLDRSSLIVSFAGDVKSKKLFDLVEKYFAALPKSRSSLPSFSKAAKSSAKNVFTAIPDKAGIDYMVGIAPRITNRHRDYPALLLGIQILGNPGFTGRLMRTVREKEGLTYVAYSYLSGLQKKTDGFVSIWSSFAPQLFEKGRAAILREVKLLAQDGATEEEVEQNRKLYEARFRVRLSNSGAIARAVHDIAADDYPLSYLETFPKRILKLTAGEVNRALKKYLKPGLLAESAAGPAVHTRNPRIEKMKPKR